MRLLTIIVISTLLATNAAAIDLLPATVNAFDRYTEKAEARMQREIKDRPFLWLDALPGSDKNEARTRLTRGEVITRNLSPRSDGAAIEVPGGLIHHWTAIVFVPGVTLQQILALLQDYNRHDQIYRPEVLRSRLLQHNDGHFEISYRLRKHKVVTVVLDTTYDVQYFALDAAHAYSRSYSTRIAELENPGAASESEKPPGHDSGFLWRLNSYWRFCQRDGGVYIQLEAISLTRDIPSGLGWLIRPFITSIPRESLVFTLGKTREALLAGRY